MVKQCNLTVWFTVIGNGEVATAKSFGAGAKTGSSLADQEFYHGEVSCRSRALLVLRIPAVLNCSLH